MFITRKADYAFRSVLILTLKEGGAATAAEVAAEADVPEKFMAKILQDLVHAGILLSERGVRGGFRLARPPAQVNLLEVLWAIQGPTACNACAVENEACGRSGACAVHPVWTEIQEYIQNRLWREDFASLARRQTDFATPRG